ncbi:MAG: hypothetical protein R3280_07220 [Marinobacter sp.]|uniref:hypothetical protein n=1 Tax=Marinobacter sp. TaxID=50741 RepID=UPI00299EFCDD|nr:hypothetical protein [Marinobacter sp.]MDX1634407.1 hypothetical protein [Marinobacter sp.]
MTACLSHPMQTLRSPAPATRNNLLALGADRPAGSVTATWPALQRLQQLGYRVAETGPEHWLLTLAQSPLEIHLYGAGELTDFTRGRACDYSIRAARSGFHPCRKPRHD